MSNVNIINIQETKDFCDLDEIETAQKFVEYIATKFNKNATNKVYLDFTVAPYYFDYSACSVIFDWFFKEATNQETVSVDRLLTIKTSLIFGREDFAYLYTKDSTCLPSLGEIDNDSKTPYSDRLDQNLPKNSLSIEILHSQPSSNDKKIASDLTSFVYPLVKK